MIDELGRNSGFLGGGPHVRQAVPFDLAHVGWLPPRSQLSRTLFESTSGLGLQFGSTAPECAGLLFGDAGFVLAHGIQVAPTTRRAPRLHPEPYG